MKGRHINQILIAMTMVALLEGCAHAPTCGNAPNAHTIYYGNSCRERIRQVIIGSELHIPSNVKRDALSNFDLRWSDPSIDGGDVRLGHYDLVPKGAAGL